MRTNLSCLVHRDIYWWIVVFRNRGPEHFWKRANEWSVKNGRAPQSGARSSSKKSRLISADYKRGVSHLYIEVAMATPVVVYSIRTVAIYIKSTESVFQPRPGCIAGYDSMEPRQRINSSYPLQFRTWHRDITWQILPRVAIWVMYEKGIAPNLVFLCSIPF